MKDNKYIVEGNIAVNNKWENLNLLIENGKIVGMDKTISADSGVLRICLRDDEGVMPGLINGHEHLTSNWYPGVYKDVPYNNSLEWLNCLRDDNYDEKLLERRKQTSFDLALLGSYKQIISGVSTIVNHAPIYRKDTIGRWQNLPIDILPDVYSSWGIYELEYNDMVWNRGIVGENKEAHDKNGLHMIHACEGKTKTDELEKLSQMIPFDERLLLIHLNALDEKEIHKLCDMKVNVCLCPTSNYNLFQVLPNADEFVKYNANLLLGTDSWLSGSISLIDEIRNFKKWFPSISDEIIYRMVTCNPMKAITHVEGYENISAGNYANLLIVSNIKADPSKTLINLNYSDINFLSIKGEAVYLSDFYFEKEIPCKPGEWSQVAVEKTKKFIWGNPKRIMERCCAKAGISNERFYFWPFENNA